MYDDDRDDDRDGYTPEPETPPQLPEESSLGDHTSHFPDEDEGDEDGE